jgi:transcriptional regulator with XRE-family HTH domain
MNEIIDRFLQAISLCMAENNLNQEQVCKQLGISPANISNLKKRELSSIRADYVRDFCVIFEYSIIWIMTGRGDPKDSNDAKSLKEDIIQIKKDIAKIKEIQGDMIETLLNQLLQPTIKPDAKTELTEAFRKKSN